MPTIILYMFIGIMLSCNTNPTNTEITDTSSHFPQENTGTNTLSGKWYLIPVLASDTSGGRLASIDFDLLENKFTGNTGCNGMGGTFLTQGDALHFNEDITTTKMACEGYNEDVFIENLHRVNKYRIDNGTLELLYNQTILSRWSRTPATSSIKKV